MSEEDAHSGLPEGVREIPGVLIIDHEAGVLDVPASPASARGRHAGGGERRGLRAAQVRWSRPGGSDLRARLQSLPLRVSTAILGALIAAPVALAAWGSLREEPSAAPATNAQAPVAASGPASGAGAGPASGPGSGPGPGPASSPATSPSKPSGAERAPAPATSSLLDAGTAKRVLEDLDGWRSAAFGALEPSMITEYAVPGTPYADEQERAMASLVSAGLRPVGLATKVMAVAGVQPAGQDRWKVGVTDVRSRYQLLDGSGITRAEVPASAPAAWLITIVRAVDGQGPRASPSEWRIAEVKPQTVLSPAAPAAAQPASLPER